MSLENQRNQRIRQRENQGQESRRYWVSALSARLARVYRDVFVHNHQTYTHTRAHTHVFFPLIPLTTICNKGFTR